MTGFAQAAAQLTPEQYAIQTVYYQAAVFFWISLACWPICLWDGLMRLPTEIKYVYLAEVKRWGQRQMPRLAPFLLLLCRILAIITIVSSFVFQRQPSNCQAMLKLTCSGLAFGTGSCLSIFALRTIAIRRAGLPLQIFLWLNVAAIFSLWLVWALVITVDQLPMPDVSNIYGPTCYNLGNIPPWLYGVYLWTALFDLFVLCLTLSATMDFTNFSLATARARGAATSKVTRQFLTDAGLYFAVSFTVHLCEFAWVYTHQHDYIYTGVILPFHGIVIFVIGPRVIANLKQTVAPASSHNGVLHGSKFVLSPTNGNDDSRNVFVVSQGGSRYRAPYIQQSQELRQQSYQHPFGSPSLDEEKLVGDVISLTPTSHQNPPTAVPRAHHPLGIQSTRSAYSSAPQQGVNIAQDVQRSFD